MNNKRAIQKMIDVLEAKIAPYKKKAGEFNDDMDYYDAEYVDLYLKLLYEARKFKEEEDLAAKELEKEMVGNIIGKSTGRTLWNEMFALQAGYSHRWSQEMSDKFNEIMERHRP